MHKKVTAEKETALHKETPMIRELEPVKETKITINIPAVLIAIAIMAAGVFTGYIFAQGTRTTINTKATTQTGTQTSKKTIGIKCEQKGEIPEGMLREGGIEDEGTHHLERDGGPARNVYITSSVVPLDEYVGKKVRVCGETVDAEKAGWLMDVVQLEVLE